MEHSLHIACKHFVETVTLISPKAIDSDDEVNLTPGDALGKALALVNQICA